MQSEVSGAEVLSCAMTYAVEEVVVGRDMYIYREGRWIEEGGGSRREIDGEGRYIEKGG